MFFIQVILAVILMFVGIAFAIAMSEVSDGISLIFIPIAFIAAGLWILLAYLSVMSLYAYGEITDNTAEIRKGIEYLFVKTDNGSTPSSAATTMPRVWRCECGMENSIENGFCIRCGKQRN